MNSDVHVAIAGAGIVGVSCALWLQSRGFKVSLIDENEPGSGATFGCACTIARYACIPINDPDILKRLPRLVFGRDTPFRIDPGHALVNLPWMIAFLKSCKKPKVDHTIRHLASLLAATDEGLGPLIERSGASDLVAGEGFMTVYQDPDEFERDLPKHRLRAEFGSPFTELGENEIRELEPALSHSFRRGLLFDNAHHVLDPQKLVERLFRHFIESGGQHVREMVHGLVHTEDGMKIYMRSRRFLRANRFVICCGAHSRQIEGCDVERLPLGTERGYHIQYSGRQHLVKRPVGWGEGGFYAVPTQSALRLAGTVEIAALDKPKNPDRIAYLADKARRMFGIDDEPDSDWLGFRPTLPDALPVIGPSVKAPNTYFALGHQHLGLTLGGITGKLVSEIVAGETPSVDIRPFSASRFK